MSRALVMLWLSLSVSAWAQQDPPSEDDKNTATGLRPSAGGPSELGPGVRSSDLGVTYEEIDVDLRLGAGRFTVVRRYTSSDTWERVWLEPQLFGSHPFVPEKIEWFSSLSSYAVLRYWGHNGPPGKEPVRRVQVQIRDVSGALVTANGFLDSGTEEASGGARVQLGSEAPFQFEEEESITLIRPGEGRWKYQRVGDCFWEGDWRACRYKQKEIYLDQYNSGPICTFNYIDDLERVETVDCFGGVSLHVTWDSDRVQELRVFPTGSDPFGFAPIVQYVYKSGRLIRAIREDGAVREYSYLDLAGYDGFTVSAGVDATGLRKLFSKTRQGLRAKCTEWSPDGTVNWYGPLAANAQLTPMGSWAYEGPQDINPSQCTNYLRSRVTHETSGVVVQETHQTIREGIGPEKVGQGLTREVARTCRAGVALCSDVADRTAEWAITANYGSAYGEPYDLWVRDFRGVYRANQVMLDESNMDIPTPLLLSTREGASDSTGNDALRTTSYQWEFFDAKDTHEPILVRRATSSALMPMGARSELYRYHAQTKQLKSTIISGYTASGTEAIEHRFIGTFVFPSHVCNGAGSPDPMRRPMEIHGPCWVLSENSTDCDVQPLNEMIPVTQFTYWEGVNGNRLKTKTTFATTTLGMQCSGGLTTTYDTYDLEGHVLHETDPSGIVTERVYSNGRLMSEARAGLTTEYLYDESQGGRVSAIKDAAGVWQVFCYRLGGTPQGRCTEGIPATELQWKARIAGPPSLPWNVLEKTSYGYSPSSGAIPYTGGGLLTAEVSELPGTPARFVAKGYTYDALERLASSSSLDANSDPLFSSPRLLDANGNLLGEGSPYNTPPTRCDGLDATATTAQSQLCTRPVYDRLERIQRISSAGNLVITEFQYDPAGNLRSVQKDGRELVEYEYDDFGNVVTVKGTWAEQNASRFVYGASGRLVARTWASLPASEALTYTYDAIGRPLGAFHNVANGPNEALWLMGYDGDTAEAQNCPSSSAPILRGRAQWKEDSFGRTWYDYDSRGLLVAERRVRVGATKCSADEVAASSNATPDTLYVYDSFGRLVETKYPHGLRVGQAWGVAGRQNEVVSMAVRRGSFTPWTPLVNNIVYDVGGALRSYSLASSPAVSVDYIRSTPAVLPSTGCDFASGGGSDGSGRLTALRVSRGSANVFLRQYGWKADQISGQSTCILDDSQPVNEEFLYDPLLQLLSGTRPPGEHASRGGPYEGVSYTYEGTERVREHTGEDWWSLEYDEFGRLRRQRPRAPSDFKDQSWHKREFEYDSDGRATAINETPVFNGVAEIFQRQIALSPDDGVGSVYRTAMVNSAVYQYLYDAQGRRRLKVYPSGFADEYFYGGSRMIEDRGLKSALSGGEFVLDQYVWLGSAPVAVVRESLDRDFQLDGSTNCTRNDEQSPCGTFFLVNDYLPKPVALIDSSGRLAGVGDYDPFGRVNTVSIRADVPAAESSLATFGHYLANRDSAIVSFAQPARTSSQRVRARVNYAQVNTERSADRTWVVNAVTGQALTPFYSGTQKAVQTPWFPMEYAQGASVWWTSNATMPKRHGGATTASYEYQRYEVGAEPTWIPLRFPGQYADPETGLFENWNRFYDPSVGRYLAADPIFYARESIQALDSNLVFGYAFNSPVGKVDPRGLQIHVATRAQGDVVRYLLSLKNGDAEVLRRLAASRTFVLRFAAPLAPGTRPSQLPASEWHGGAALLHRGGAGVLLPSERGSQEKWGESRMLVPSFVENSFYGNIYYDVARARQWAQNVGHYKLPMEEDYLIAHELGHGMGHFARYEQGLDPIWHYEASESDADRIEGYLRSRDGVSR